MPAIELLAPVLSVAFLSGLIQGLSGFGSALIGVPLLSFLLPIDTVVPLMALLGALVSTFNLIHLRHAVRLKPMLPLVAGYLIGAPLGLFTLTSAPEALMLGILGVFLFSYALLSLSGRQPRAAWLRERRVSLGVVSGALGSAFSTSGPPIILHVAAHPEWEPDRQKATLVLFFMLASGITISAHSIGGLVTADVLTWFGWNIPMLIAGTQTGILIYRKLGKHDYRRLTFALILTTGCLLVWRAITGIE
jgi:uncharacterized membrane protein YfcA